MAKNKSSNKAQSNLDKMKSEINRKKLKAEEIHQSGLLTTEIVELSEAHLPLQAEAQVSAVYESEKEDQEVCTADKDESQNVPPENSSNVDPGELGQDNRQYSSKELKTNLVVFRLGDEEFAIELCNVREINRVSEMIKVPNAPSYIVGLCSLRGELLPIIDSHKRFNVHKGDYNENSRIIVMEISGRRVGIITDKVSEVLSVDKSFINEPPRNIKNIIDGCINGIISTDSGKRLIMNVDVQSLVSFNEIDSISEKAGIRKDIALEADQKEEEEQLIIFSVDKEDYAFDISKVKEIIRLPESMKVPNTVDYIEGVLSLRNNLITVVNLRKLLNVESRENNEHTRVIVIDTGNLTYGVIVDRVIEVARVSRKVFSKPSQIIGDMDVNLIKEFANLGNNRKTIMVLDLSVVLK